MLLIIMDEDNAFTSGYAGYRIVINFRDGVEQILDSLISRETDRSLSSDIQR